MNYKDRTAFYKLSYKHEGTVYVESLTSYITRLAEVHLIQPKDLLKYVFEEGLPKQYLLNSINRGGNRFYDRANSLNGFGTTSIDMVKIFEVLTGHKNMSCLTLDSFSEVISQRSLLRKNMAWCPKCLENDLYYPLIWSLSSYTVCSVHEKELQDLCVSCGKTVPFLLEKVELGYAHIVRINTIAITIKNHLENQLVFLMIWNNFYSILEIRQYSWI